MAVPNSLIARLFDELADLLEIEGANPYRVRAYRNAARTIGTHPSNLAEAARRHQLPRMPGIGRDLEGKIEEIAATRSLKLLREVEKRVPPAVREMLQIPHLGPKRVRILQRDFGISGVRALTHAAQAGRLREIPGFGPKLEGQILMALTHPAPKDAEGRPSPERRFSLVEAEEEAKPLLDYLRSIPGVSEAVAVGSLRRRKETIGDLDILIIRSPDSPVMERFVQYEEVAEILAQGEKRSTVRFHSGIQVDLRVFSKSSFGAALVYFTGSKAHNIALRSLALRKGLKVNEYGVYSGTKKAGGAEEEEIYRLVGLAFIEPELREDRGEIQAAQTKPPALPRLVRLEDIRGDLHSHTTETDGRLPLEKMVEAAQARGREYLAITDHTQRLTVTRGQDPKRLLQQIRKIEKLNGMLQGFTVLKSAEVDILEDGSLDLPDWILQELDLTVCSIHSKFDLGTAKQTERVLRAMDHPSFTILGHPTGRLIDRREPYALDLERVIEGASERKCFLELDSQPDRLDLSDVYCKAAKENGVQIAISSDAHSAEDLDNIRYGVDQARRGWLEKKDVLNARSWSELSRILRNR